MSEPVRAIDTIAAGEYQNARNAMARLHTQLTAFIADSQASNTTYQEMLEMYRRLTNCSNELNKTRGTKGIVQYARDQEEDQTYDVAGAFLDQLGRISAAMSWIETNIPLTGIEIAPINGSEPFKVLTEFTPAQTNGLRNQLQPIVDNVV